VSKEFREYASTFDIRTKAVPVEAHNSIGIVERYHGPIRRIYQIVRTELPSITKEIALQMAFKAINDTAGPDGLVPTLLVFGAYPRMTESSPPAATVAQRTIAINKAMAEVRKLRTERQIAEALRTRNGPKVDGVHDLPINSDVLVWREGNTNQLGHWDGPYKLLAVEAETCTVQINSGSTAFRSTVVKPYFQDQQDDLRAATPIWDNPTPVQPPEQPVRLENASPTPVQPKRGRGRPRKYPILSGLTMVNLQGISSPGLPQFQASRQKELTGLLEKGVFGVVGLGDVPAGVRLFNSRFVDEIKHQGTPNAYEKSRLVVQAYNDQEKDVVLT
jgi:hypothetical protein